jgi:hypothetical protein
MNPQNSVLVVGPNTILLDRRRYSKRADKLAARTLAAMRNFFRRRSISPDGQLVVFNTDIKRRPIDSRQINRDGIPGIVFENVSSRIPVAAFDFICGRGFARAPGDASSNNWFMRSCSDTRSCKGFHCAIAQLRFLTTRSGNRKANC